MNYREYDATGRHGLRIPGGDNQQIDVADLLPDRLWPFAATVDPDYVGKHRRSHIPTLAEWREATR